MRASKQAITFSAPLASAKASNVEMATTGNLAPKPRPCATPAAMRTPVNEPGPEPKAIPCKSDNCKLALSSKA